MFEDPGEDFDLHTMEAHIWRLIMEKSIFFSMVTVVLLAVMALVTAGLITTLARPDHNSPAAQADPARDVLVRCDGGRLTPYETGVSMPDDLTDRRVALVLAPEEAMCVAEGFELGASAFVFAELESSP